MGLPDHPALPAMVDAVRGACRICTFVQDDLVRAKEVTKDDRSPVTVADFASQAYVAHRLEETRPELPLVAEEASDLLREDEHRAVREAVVRQVGRQWEGAGEAAVLAAIDRGGAECDGSGRYLTLDPIDGTKGFLRGEHYAVALALLEDGRVVAGVLGCPNLPGPGGSTGLIVAAASGHGAGALSLAGEEVVPIRVSEVTDPRDARFCESVVKAHSHKGRSARVAEILGVRAEPVRMDSQCKYALVSRGDAELYLRIPRDDVYREKIWDHAAGVIVLTEAGGRVTDVLGRPLDFGHGRTLDENRGVVASNGPIHDAVIEALART